MSRALGSRRRRSRSARGVAGWAAGLARLRPDVSGQVTEMATRDLAVDCVLDLAREYSEAGLITSRDRALGPGRGMASRTTKARHATVVEVLPEFIAP